MCNMRCSTCNMHVQYEYAICGLPSRCCISRFSPLSKGCNCKICSQCLCKKVHPPKNLFLQTTCLDNMQCAVHRSCVSRLRDSDLLANSVSCSMACNGGSWSKYTMASSTSSSSPTQPLGPKTMTMIMTGQVKRMQSPCEGLTMLILIFIMMKITQMLIMQS